MNIIPLQNHIGNIQPLYKLKDHKRFHDKRDFIAVSTHETIEMISIKDILYCKSESNYTCIHLVNGKEHVISKTLKTFELGLGHTFLRVHNSYLVNLSLIRSFSFKDCNIKMQGEATIPVSRRKKEEVISYLKGFEF